MWDYYCRHAVTLWESSNHNQWVTNISQKPLKSLLFRHFYAQHFWQFLLITLYIGWSSLSLIALVSPNLEAWQLLLPEVFGQQPVGGAGDAGPLDGVVQLIPGLLHRQPNMYPGRIIQAEQRYYSRATQGAYRRWGGGVEEGLLRKLSYWELKRI